MLCYANMSYTPCGTVPEWQIIPYWKYSHFSEVAPSHIMLALNTVGETITVLTCLVLRVPLAWPNIPVRRSQLGRFCTAVTDVQKLRVFIYISLNSGDIIYWLNLLNRLFLLLKLSYVFKGTKVSGNNPFWSHFRTLESKKLLGLYIKMKQCSTHVELFSEKHAKCDEISPNIFEHKHILLI